LGEIKPIFGSFLLVNTALLKNYCCHSITIEQQEIITIIRISRMLNAQIVTASKTEIAALVINSTRG
jgi:hypothetical protein